MRILLATDWFVPRLGGIELQVRDLAARLAGHGHDVHVLTTTPADPDRQGELQARAPAVPAGVEVHRLRVPLLGGSGPSLSPRLPRAAARAIAAVGPDVVHVHAGVVPPLALAAGHAARAAGIPVVVTLHSVLGPVRPAWWLSRVMLGWSGWASILAGVGPAVADELAAVTGRPVRVLPNGVDVAAWAPDAPGRAGSDGGTDPAAPLRLVTVMRLQRRKRGAALLDAVSGARRRLAPGRDVTLTVVGDGPRRSALERRARRRGLDGNVRFLGARDRDGVPALFAEADAFVTAAVMESFGLAAMEARAAGLPVVARGDSGVAAHVRHGVEGLLAEDDAALEDALVRLGRDPELLARLGRYNREHPPTCDWPAVIAAHLEAYGDALLGVEDASSATEGAPVPEEGAEAA